MATPHQIFLVYPTTEYPTWNVDSGGCDRSTLVADNPIKELHAHLNGSISTNTIQKLIEYKKSKMKGNFVIPKEWELSITGNNKRTLEQCFMMFKIVYTLVDDPHSLEMITKDVIKDFHEDSVYYLELRSTPRANEANKMTKRTYIETVLKTIEETTKEIDITVRFLLSIDRRQSVKEAEETVDLAIEFREQFNKLVVGIDLSGDPSVGRAENFIPCLARAKSSGLKLTLHVAEIPNCIETKQLLKFQPDRIGHGTCIYPDKGGDMELVDMMLQSKIPIELCLTSNVKGCTVASYEDHHFKNWHKNNHPVIVCTDDKGVFSSSLSQEYAIAASVFNMNKLDVWNLSFNSIDYIFEEAVVKEQLKAIWKKWKAENNYI